MITISAIKPNELYRISLDTSMQEPKCFFCNELSGEMHKASSENMLENVQQSSVTPPLISKISYVRYACFGYTIS